MSICSFCGAKEVKKTPVCQSCGALRYPIETNHPSAPLSRQQKLKLSAALAVAAITPGALIVLALARVSRFNTKINK